jgi:hypothetical protein
MDIITLFGNDTSPGSSLLEELSVELSQSIPEMNIEIKTKI